MQNPLTLSKKPSCTVRVVVNPTTKQSVRIKYDLDKYISHLTATFYCPRVESLHPLMARWTNDHGNFPFTHGYRVIFDWRGTPDIIKRDQQFKNNIYKIGRSVFVVTKNIIVFVFAVIVMTN